MPDPGLSLLGFMDQAQAIVHLEQVCIVANPTPAILMGEWMAAKANLGPPQPKAGQPDIQLMSRTHPYIQSLAAQPWVAQLFQSPDFVQANFAIVEIDPLLAFQHTVSEARIAQHNASLSPTPTLDEMLPICLPQTLPNEPASLQLQSHSLLIKARSLNMRLRGQGLFGQIAGIDFGPSVPLVQVSRLNGRCYLSNGFHRATYLRKSGATYMPCILRDASSAASVGINDNTFGLPLLESADPPTVGHFAQGKAHSVSLRRTSRVIHLSWSEWAVYDE